jgi:tRNA(fMet)-specific endonuclease VapC
MAQVCICSIREAELLLGLALKPEATKLAELVNQFLFGACVLPWDSAAARALSRPLLRLLETGPSTRAMDMLVAA